MGECATTCPGNTMSAIGTAVEACASGTASAVTGTCSTIAAIPGAILDCPAQTGEYVSNVCEGVVDAYNEQCVNPCAGFPTTHGDCVDVGEQACDAVTCNANIFSWRSFIVLNRYSREVMEIRSKTPNEKKMEKEHEDWKNAADFNYMVCHAYMDSSDNLESLKKKKREELPRFYQSISNPSRVSNFKDVIMIDPTVDEDFEVSYIVCEIPCEAKKENEAGFEEKEKELLNVHHSYDFLKKHIDFFDDLAKNNDKWRKVKDKKGKETTDSNDLLSNCWNIKNMVQNFRSGKVLTEEDFKKDDVALDFLSSLTRLSEEIKGSSCFQADSVFAKVVHTQNNATNRLYASIQRYEYIPGKYCKMFLRFNDKDKLDKPIEFTFHATPGSGDNGKNRLLKIIPRFRDVVIDDNNCGSADVKVEASKEPSVSREYSGFLYREKVVYVAMNKSNLDAIRNEAMNELVRVRVDDGFTKKREELDDTADNSMREKNKYKFGLDYSYRYYECQVLRIIYDNNAVEVGLIPLIDENANDDAKYSIENEPISNDRVFPYDPSNYNIINFPRTDKMNKDGGMFGPPTMKYHFEYEKDKRIDLPPRAVGSMDPYVVAFTPFCSDSGEKTDSKSNGFRIPEYANATPIPSEAISNGSNIKTAFLVGKMNDEEVGRIPVSFVFLSESKSKSNTDQVDIGNKKITPILVPQKKDNKDMDEYLSSNTYVISVLLDSKDPKVDDNYDHVTIVGDSQWRLHRNFAMDFVPRVLSQHLEMSVTIKAGAGVGNEFTFLGKVSLFNFKDGALSMQLIYGNHLLQIPGVKKSSHEKHKKDHWCIVENNNRFNISFIHPETPTEEIFSHEQRVTFTYHNDEYPGTVKDINFTSTSTMMSVDLDRGDQGRKVHLEELKLRPDLIRGSFKEDRVFEKGVKLKRI